MNKFLRYLAFALASLPFIAGYMPARADNASLADYHYVLQISEGAGDRQTLVLNNAKNLLDAYPPGDVEVEVVAYGPGLRMLFADNANAERIQSLALSGVRFSACNNTLKGMTKLLGETPKLNKAATVVPGGVVRIGELVKQGYIYIKP
jgi:intracellular sulfur oxidation DsrE/DsrF family protein